MTFRNGSRPELLSNSGQKKLAGAQEWRCPGVTNGQQVPGGAARRRGTR
jgi:hypothetical protein